MQASRPGPSVDVVKRGVPLRYQANEIPPVTQVRSTLVSSSIRAITSAGRLAEYEKLLPPQLHAAVVGTIAGSWLGIDVAIAHYRVMDALVVDVRDQLSVGETVGSTVRSYLFGTSRTAPVAGATPWTILPHTRRTWDRLYVGGDVSIEETGPQEFVRTIYGLPLCEIPYFRNASRGTMQSVISRWCTKCEVTETSWTSTTLQWRISWM